MAKTAKVVWKEVEQDGDVYGHAAISRAKVFGGWFIQVHEGGHVEIFFLPDPDHKWGTE